jgi:hypothetical protein
LGFACESAASAAMLFTLRSTLATIACVEKNGLVIGAKSFSAS